MVVMRVIFSLISFSFFFRVAAAATVVPARRK